MHMPYNQLIFEYLLNSMDPINIFLIPCDILFGQSEYHISQ